MRFMNDYDISQALRRWDDGEHSVLLAASCTLDNLREAADANSDGWAYWPKPAHSAAKLMELIEGDGTNEFFRSDRPDPTLAELRRAYSPIKAFRTRSGIAFHIHDLTPRKRGGFDLKLA